MKPRAYLETTVVSYLTGRIGRNLIIAAHQELTREWWDEVLPVLGGCISDLVLEEASDGDATAAAKRLEALKTHSCSSAWQSLDSNPAGESD